MKDEERDRRFERAVVREALDAMNFMTYQWLRGGWHYSRREHNKIKKLHCH